MAARRQLQRMSHVHVIRGGDVTHGAASSLLAG
jgi:hypothetical protein